MKTVIYKSTGRLECQCDSEVILCIDDSLTASGAPFIEATLVSTTFTTNACLEAVNNYHIDYDENNLADPTYSLKNTDINGIVCRGCLTSYIDYYVGLLS